MRRPSRRRRIELSPLFPVEGIFPLEIRDAVLPDREGLRLKEQVLEAQFEGRIGHPAIFFWGYGPPELFGGRVADTAPELGFQTLFLQPEPFADGAHRVPDFEREDPFDWK